MFLQSHCNHKSVHLYSRWTNKYKVQTTWVHLDRNHDEYCTTKCDGNDLCTMTRACVRVRVRVCDVWSVVHVTCNIGKFCTNVLLCK